jgi:hypothetical protein
VLSSLSWLLLALLPADPVLFVGSAHVCLIDVSSVSTPVNNFCVSLVVLIKQNSQ